MVDEQGVRWDIQLKGAGQTPYSRMADGRAVLRSTIREYLCSEAMHALGIPTTRALCIVATHEPVYRHEAEPGAILTRVSESHIRIGHFEYFYYTGQHEILRQLADYVLTRHYPEQPCSVAGYEYLFEQAVLKTARLVAHWQAVGFCHGVMNTDNMSILGLTIDYGPFGFLDAYDAGHVCNSSDESGRYAFDQQPRVAYWNLMALAQALSPLISPEKRQHALAFYQPELTKTYHDLMNQKLGLQQHLAEDMQLVSDLLDLMQSQTLDYTVFMRQLSEYHTNADKQQFYPFSKDQEAIESWLEDYDNRLKKESRSDENRQQQMKKVNPKYVLRNYLAQQAIERAYKDEDYREIKQLFTLLQKPFDEQPEFQVYSQLPPGWAKGICVSCSS